MYMDERRPLPQSGAFCAYLRKSREEERAEQAGRESDVLGKHDMMLRYTADMRGHELEHAYKEVVSGSDIASRDQVQALIEAVKKGEWTGVYLMAVDRLSRGNQKDQSVIIELLEVTGIFLVTPAAYYDPWYPQDLDAIIYQLSDAHKEYKAYVRRLHDGAVVSVLQGQFIGSFTPYAFTKAKTEHGLKTLEPIREQAKWVVRMYEWYADEGLSMWAIAKRLNEMGVEPPRRSSSEGWRKEAVTYILTNPVYAGWAIWGRHTTKRTFSTDVTERGRVHVKAQRYIKAPALWEPIVSQELYDRVQERIALNKPFSPSRQTVNPLAGLLVCSGCGRSMFYLSSRGRRRYQHQNWLEKCEQKGAFASVVLDKLVDVLQERLDDVEISLADGRETKERERAQEAVANLSRQLKAIDKRDANLITMRSKDEITAAELRTARADLTAEREQAEARLAEAERTLEVEAESEALVTKLHTALEVLKDDEVSGAAKNAMLREFIKRIEYTNTSKERTDDELHLKVVFR